MKVNMDIDDLIEYVIEEDKKFNALLVYLNCI